MLSWDMCIFYIDAYETTVLHIYIVSEAWKTVIPKQRNSSIYTRANPSQ